MNLISCTIYTKYAIGITNIKLTKKLEMGKTSYRICEVKYLFIVFISY